MPRTSRWSAIRGCSATAPGRWSSSSRSPSPRPKPPWGWRSSSPSSARARQSTSTASTCCAGDGMNALDLIWLVPALPFAGAAVNGLLLRNRQKSLVTAVGVGFPGLSLLIALAALAQYLGSVRPAAFEQVLYAWTTGALSLDIGFRVDPLSAVMLFVVTFVGFWIHVYSVGYMGPEEGHRRYFAY